MSRTSSQQSGAADQVGDMVTSTSKYSGGRRRAYSGDSLASINIYSTSVSHYDDSTAPSLRSSTSFTSHTHLLRPHSLALTLTDSNLMHPEMQKTSPGPFETSLLPLPGSPRAQQFSAPMPPTLNELSAGERRNLVKRSKKLQAMLGATLDEAATERTLVGRGPLRHNSGPFPVSPTLKDEFEASAEWSPTNRRRSSYPPPSPTQSFGPSSPASARYAFRSEAHNAKSPESNMSRSSSSGLTMDFTSPDTNHSYSPPTPRDFYSPNPNLWGSEQAPMHWTNSTKEERRRRVQKVYAVLGEVVPVDVIFGSPDPGLPHPRSSRDKHVRSPSRLGQAGDAISRSFGILKRKNRQADGSTSEEEWVKIQNQAQAAPSPFASLVHKENTPQHLQDASIEQLKRARKLEHIFGELPCAPLSVFSMAV